MSNSTEWFPPFEIYTLAVPCGTCGAEVGVGCTTPPGRPASKPHPTRRNRATTLSERDYAPVPWPEDRIPGKRYDSLGDLWNGPSAEAVERQREQVTRLRSKFGMEPLRDVSVG